MNPITDHPGRDAEEGSLKSVAVVLLSWNRGARVVDCIARVKQLTRAIVRIVVVDNASTDDSVALIKRLHPDVVLIEQRTNTGYVGGVNRGLDEAVRLGVDYAWLLNDDTGFENDVLASMLDFASKRPEHFVFAPVIRTVDDLTAVQFGNGFVDWVHAHVRGSCTEAEHARAIGAGATPVLTGTALLCDIRAVQAPLRFDPQYFAYWEDIDFSVRAARAGFASCVVPDASVLHDSPDRNERPAHHHYYMIRNEALFWRLHHPGKAPTWQRSWLAKALEWVGENRDLGKAENVQACADGIWDAVKGRFGPRFDHAHSPRWFVKMVSGYPHLLAALVRGDFSRVSRRLVRRAG